MAEADLQGETRGLEGAVLEELDVGGLVCDCVVRGEQGEEYWQRTQGHGGAGGGGGSQATAEAQTTRFKAAKRWAEAAEAARKVQVRNSTSDQRQPGTRTRTTKCRMGGSAQKRLPLSTR